MSPQRKNLPQREEAAEEPAADAGEAEAAAEEPAAEDATADEPAAEEGESAEHAAEGADEGHAEAEGGGHGGGHIEDIDFSFEGPFGKYDQFQLQRGLQVYTEVCSACHGMKFVPIRTLHDEGGPGLPEDQVRAYAANMTIIDKETGEERPRLPTDHFPAVTGDGMGPDLSLMAKARAGFHGPYGTGISQFFNGIGGPEYIHAILTGYTGEEIEQAGTVLYENTAFSTGSIGMPPPLSEDLVTYEDGTPATVDQMATDVAAFLMWTAEPKLMDRKQVGLVSVLFLIVLTALLYLTNKRLWAPHKGKKLDT
ncbi:cytochrome c1 [Paracoccus methylarcula]|uniref:Cytochrome c1 n=1 Tax=Paracoccus methylarcula TaxID=72022 RepID=A0A422QY15_9RHOB|nr:cytochrome c1 [Paracoccus methylarcula]RNF34852.1 cytochrome c1 [Paracoccus methylarcula]